MDYTLENKLNELFNSYNKIRKGIKWINPYIMHFLAFHYTFNGTEFDKSKFLELKKYIKALTNLTSVFRTDLNMSIVSCCCMNSPDSKAQFTKTLKISDSLLESGFKNWSSLPICSCYLATFSKFENLKPISKAAYNMYFKMTNTPNLLSLYEDSSFALLLSIDGNDIDDKLDKIQALLNYLKEMNFEENENLQIMAYILSSSNYSSTELIHNCLELNKLLSNTYKLRSISYPYIALLSLFNKDNNDIVKDICDVFTYIKNNSLFDSLDDEYLFFLSMSFIICDYTYKILNNSEDKTTVSANENSIFVFLAKLLIISINHLSTKLG
ncbi:DUF4003 family protein [Oceanirhabdus sp. W0125-5]|uniref:DUF4003 family protein n=1 Tax=Oceanirhabdus sp. W0125-5 TaxID=2999116 RepID=UPI0022F2C63C|nr:DUF4003 family protein [Oceanirhabdus sp. W0125-5]WBW99149.1 DUF4003 family protein [Oceanirhabdus sp. W0125-5]